MARVAVFARLDAKRSNESAVEELSRVRRSSPTQRPPRNVWCALTIGPATFGIFMRLPTNPDGKRILVRLPLR